MEYCKMPGTGIALVIQQVGTPPAGQGSGPMKLYFMKYVTRILPRTSCPWRSCHTLNLSSIIWDNPKLSSHFLQVSVTYFISCCLQCSRVSVCTQILFCSLPISASIKQSLLLACPTPHLTHLFPTNSLRAE